MDDLDRRIWILLQNPLPFSLSPVERLAASLGVSHREAVERLAGLRRRRLFAKLDAQVDLNKVKYRFALGALRFEHDELRVAAIRILRNDPGVVFADERCHRFSLWFYLALPPQDRPEVHIEALKRLSGAVEALHLPARKIFVRRRTGPGIGIHETAPASGLPQADRRCSGEPGLEDAEKRLLHVLAKGWPLTLSPVQELAAWAGLTELQARQGLESLGRRGIVRTFTAVPAESREGDRIAGALIAWMVPEEREAGLAQAFMADPAVRRVSKRPPGSGFEYNYYAEAGACTTLECDEIIRRLEARIGKWPREAVVRTQTIKNIPLRVFDPALEEWNQRAGIRDKRLSNSDGSRPVAAT